jgi:hypothetical protein
MPIVMTEDRGLICPQVFCDLCKERIHAAKDGNIEWPADDPSQLLYVHKKCDMVGMRWHEVTGHWMRWRDLNDFFNQIQNPENLLVSELVEH